jgi:hypothetical protein
MSLRAARWSLWLIFGLALPLPYYMVETGRVPLASLVVFSALTIPLAITDPSLTTRFMAVLFTVQTLFFAFLLVLAARLIANRLPPTRRLAMITGIAVAVVLLAMSPVYLAPLSHGPGSTNWLGLWR